MSYIVKNTFKKHLLFLKNMLNLSHLKIQTKVNRFKKNLAFVLVVAVISAFFVLPAMAQKSLFYSFDLAKSLSEKTGVKLFETEFSSYAQAEDGTLLKRITIEGMSSDFVVEFGAEKSSPQFIALDANVFSLNNIGHSLKGFLPLETLFESIHVYSAFLLMGVFLFIVMLVASHDKSIIKLQSILGAIVRSRLWNVLQFSYILRKPFSW
jgi:hypothetical protein